jgi:Ser/Thr protein kinase RdoA (MazF antagonist)
MVLGDRLGMMRLSTMWRVDATIDDNGHSVVADRIGDAWNLAGSRPRFIRSSSNFIYGVGRNDTRRFLRFADATERRRDEIDAEVSLVAWLAAEGVAVAAPIASRTGHLVETIETEAGTFHAVLFDGLAGEHPDIETLTEDDYGLWGAALGRLHAMTRLLPASLVAARSSWRDDFATVRRSTPPQAASLLAELDRAEVLLDSLPRDADSYGLIHGDFELDNLLWRSETIGIVDFDDCAHHWYAADIAFALRDLFAGEAGPIAPVFAAFVAGYRTHHGVSDAMLATVPFFVRLAELVGYGRILPSLDLYPGDDHPDWLHDLHRRLRRMADAVSHGNDETGPARSFAGPVANPVD